MIVFTIDGVPQPKGRPRFTRNGHTYTPDKTRHAEAEVVEAYEARYCLLEPTELPVRIGMVFYMPIPKSTSRKKREQMLRKEIYPEKKPDIDNLQKLVLDALNGLAYKDDKQVVEISAVKVYSEEPRTVVKIEEVE